MSKTGAIDDNNSVEVKQEEEFPIYRDGWMWGELPPRGNEPDPHDVIDLVESDDELTGGEAAAKIEKDVSPSNARDTRALLRTVRKIEMLPIIIKEEPSAKTPENTVEGQAELKQTIETSSPRDVKHQLRKRLKKFVMRTDQARIINPYLLERRPGPFPQPIPYQGAIRRPLFRRARGSEPPCDRS